MKLRTFKPGDEVIYWSKETGEGTGFVVSHKDKWVYIETQFGPCPFDELEVEWADVPF